MHISDKIDADGRTIPLTPYVKSLLTALPRHNDYVFYSERSSTTYIVEPTKSLKLAAKNAGLDDLSIHGLRRSLRHYPNGLHYLAALLPRLPVINLVVPKRNIIPFGQSIYLENGI